MYIFGRLHLTLSSKCTLRYTESFLLFQFHMCSSLQKMCSCFGSLDEISSKLSRDSFSIPNRIASNDQLKINQIRNHPAIEFGSVKKFSFNIAGSLYSIFARDDGS